MAKTEKKQKMIAVMFAISIATVVGLAYYLKPVPADLWCDCSCPEVYCPDCWLEYECPECVCQPRLNCSLVCPKCPSSSRTRDYEHIEKVVTVPTYITTTTIPVTTTTSTTSTTTTTTSTTTVIDC